MDKRKRSNVNEIWKKSIWEIHKISYNNLTIILVSGVPYNARELHILVKLLEVR
jgi:hypothetical protein